MSDLYQRIASLSPEKRKLLLQQLNKKKEEVFSKAEIKPCSRERNFFPLSFAQQRLWFLNQLDPNNSAYNIHYALRLSGKLNLIALEQSLNEIVRRQEALRTTFKVVDGQPVQVIAPSLTLKLPVINLQELPKAQQEAEVLRLSTQQAQFLFNFIQGPLLKTTLLQLSEQEYVALFTMHHIVSDGWSMQILIQEVGALYSVFSQRQPSLLPELSVQYVDFATWQRQWLVGEVLESQLSYWQKQLDSAPLLLELPTDFPRPAVQSSQGATYAFKVPLKVSVELKTLSQREGCTLFMTLLAAFKTLLHRYTGSNDILVGSPIANRNRNEIEGLIGFFVNTLVLRTSFEGNPSFRELLRQVREVALGAYAHQDAPFEQLVEKLQLQRNLSHAPLFQVMFVLQNASKSEIELPGLTLSALESDTGTANFDLTLSMTETAVGLIGTLEYSTDLFKRSTILRMVEHLQTLLSGIIANPEQRLSELPLLTAAERNQLLIEWNRTETDYPLSQCIHQLFEAQVERTPDATALVFEDQQLTYKQLNQRANQLAYYLQKLGVKPEVLVGICVERSLLMVIGILAILKAGGAYVPLDPSYPKERLALMLEDAKPLVLLTQARLVTELPHNSREIVYIDTFIQENFSDAFVKNVQKNENSINAVKPENLAYVIYTSGSTGKPKGVMILHHSLVNFTQTAVVKYGLTKGDRILQFASISFDAAAEEIYPCLVSGGTLVLRTDEMLSSGQAFLQKCHDLKLTVLDLPTAYWQQLMLDLKTANLVLPESLRLVIIGGEAALPEAVEIWQNYVGERQELVNTYGPTEATVVATMYKLPKLAPPANTPLSRLPIGQPLDNVQTYVLNRYLQLVPVGVPGELHIGGAGIARGYLNRPELTADKFIPNPFSHESGGRLYKTGDLVRYLPNGDIEFLGRIDHQVKIRGYRIELAEIEALLSQHPGVQQTVVVAHADKPGDKRIVAYWVTEQQPAPAISELRRFLSKKLPEYMIPSVFVQIATLPLTPSGKVDRRALPAPDTARPELDKEFVAPRTPVEAKLAEIWAEVLRLEQVGIYDNFFDLGGDSILTIQIVAKANQSGLQLTPKQLFQYQNIAELACTCLTNQATQAEQGLITGTVPLTPIQHWFFEQNFVAPHHYNQAVLLEVQEKLDLELLKQALQHLLIHHDVLRLRFEQTQSGWQQSHTQPDNTIPLVTVDLSALPSNRQPSALETAASEFQACLNLSQAPLVRVVLFELGAQKHSRLLVLIHHLVVDGVSWRILLEDLETAYAQLSQGEVVKLPAKTTSFKKFSEKLQEYANSSKARQELNYWLTDARQKVSSVLKDFSEGANTVDSARVVSVKLGVEETELLLKEVPSAYRTQINDVLLTALVETFAQWRGEKALLIYLEGHGREDIFDDVDLSRTVGWFTSVFPVLLDLQETSSLGEALKAVKEQLRAIPNRGIGYGILRYLNENTETTAWFQNLPQPEVVFNYLGQFDQTFSESSLFRIAQESHGLTHSLRDKRSELLDINSFVIEGQLQVDWTYSEEIHHRSTIETLALGFVDALRALITHCTSPSAGGYTPSDFPLAKINQKQLDDLLEQYQQIEDIYPLSPMQQGMLFHTLYDQNSDAYFTQTSCTLRGNFNLSAFQQAWQKVIERHTILRTAFFWEGLDTPVQVVLKHIDLPYQQQDWRELTPNEQQTRLDTFLQTDRAQGFNPASAPLMRLILIQLADNTYQLIWSQHHILLDGWSTPLLLQEVFVLYQAFCHSQIPTLEQSRPYRDYIAWLQQQNLLEAETFWRRVLKGFTTPTPLGISKNSQQLTDEKELYNEQELKFSLTTTTALQSLAKQHQLTLNTVLQGAWGLLLSHYSGKQDVIFGATISSRPATLAGVESMVGLFINTLPVRVQICHDEHLISWLQQLQSQQVETRQYEYTPLVQVQKWSEVPQGVPLFESVMVFENFPDNSSLHDELELEFQNNRTVIRNHYPLTVRVQPGSMLSLVIMYDCRFLEPHTVAKIANHFESLLSQFVNQPHSKLTELATLLREIDKQQQVLKEKELENVSLEKFKLTKRKAIRQNNS
jgi:amino acid adenylation domain-containing protein/non-ribosomal peptide synthase protein (TIGR01720 family)